MPSTSESELLEDCVAVVPAECRDQAEKGRMEVGWTRDAWYCMVRSVTRAPLHLGQGQGRRG